MMGVGQEGFWSWVAGVTDNSIYPVLFASYLEIAMPNLVTGWRRTLLCMAISIALVRPPCAISVALHCAGISLVLSFPLLVASVTFSDTVQKVSLLASDSALGTLDCYSKHVAKI